VGDVIGKYHPHGDQAVYDTIVRMAQDFSMRYPLIDGQGNFGSIDGDPPAAMRYTEVRMTRLASEMLVDLDKETVEFGPNYDESLTEPLLLPCRFPNLLVNGSAGIAVGMATNIPPHNLNEVVDGLIALIDNPAITVNELIGIVPGPDFPTGGFIHGRSGIEQAYRTGRGSIQMRARTHVETNRKGDRASIVVTEIPYQVNKSRLLETIAELAREKKIDGIAEVRDESDREGMRIVIDLKRDFTDKHEIVLNQLFKHTKLQDSFGIIMLGILNHEPRVFNLKELLVAFLSHRKEVVTRRCRYELKEARKRLHILEGFRIAFDHLEAVIDRIKRAGNPAEAKGALVADYGMSEIQAQSILDMRLHRLTSLEREKIVQEHADISAQIEKLETVLRSERLILDIIRQELIEVKVRYGDPRRTEIIDQESEINIEDIIADEDMVVTISHGGYIKRSPMDVYRHQKRGGKGKIGMTTKEDDFVEHLFIASMHSYILFFTTLGKVYWLKVYNIPEQARSSRGKAIVNFFRLEPGEKISAFLPVRAFEEHRYVVMATRHGKVKKTDLLQFKNVRKDGSGIRALRLEAGDELIGVRMTDGNQEILLSTKGGKAIRFSESEVRNMGRTAAGVKGITLADGDEVVSLEVLTPGATILSVCANGYGKRTPVEEYRRQQRGGQGIITIKTTRRNGPVVGILQVTKDEDVILMTSSGKIIRIRATEIRVTGRNTQGVRLVRTNPGETVVAVAPVAEREVSEAGNDPLLPGL
ncbi:MAG: DNA gyrase subunit A, partial [Deltaproteobacteria bacterium]